MQGLFNTTSNTVCNPLPREMLRSPILSEPLSLPPRERDGLFLEKSTLVSAVGHDLGQVLGAMHLYNESLSRRVTDPMSHRLAHQMTNAITAMQIMLDSILNLLRCDARYVSPIFSVFDLAGVLDALDRDFAPQADAKGLQWTCGGDNVVLRSDPVLFEIVLRNLINNAVKYTSRGTVWVTCNKVDAQHVAVAVGDTGVGIAEAQLPDIFRENYRERHNRAKSEFGMGLGLSIASRISALLGIQLSVVSQLNVGSVFTATISINDM